jgi:hypothetical protein
MGIVLCTPAVFVRVANKGVISCVKQKSAQLLEKKGAGLEELC